MRALRPLLLILLLLPILSGCTAMLDLRKADKHFGYGEYFAAATQYGKALRGLKTKQKKEKAHAAFNRGECYRLLSLPIKAETEYRKAIRFNTSNDTVYLRLAQMLQRNAKYDEAGRNFEQYLVKHPEDTLALNGLSACHLIQKWQKNVPKYTVRKVAVLNSRKGDFSPVLMPEDYNTLILTSSAYTKKGVKPSNITGLPDNDFWKSEKDASGNWSKPQYMDAAINSEFDEGTAAFTPDGKTLFFTRCITRSDSIKSTSKVEIFRSLRTGAEWSAPEKVVVYRDSTVLFAHPAVSPDGLYLYYVSNMKGGYGGKDLWRSQMQGTTLGIPENLGPTINTSGDEMFPTFRNNGDLYFSSNGHPGFGGLDIFRAKPLADGGYEIENLMQQINSSGDDFGMTFAGKEDKGFFSSNRKEPRGWDKIYSFELPSTQVSLEGNVTDRYGEPVPDATIRIVSDKGMNSKTRADKTGHYKLQVDKDADYVLMGTCRSYLNNSNRFYAYNKTEDTTYLVDFVLTPLHKAIRIENVFFEFGKWELKPESFPALAELIKIMQDNPHIVVEIGSHTDRVGTDEYNNFLSQKRADAVVAYLVEQGIEQDRLEAHGYGKTVPATVDSYMQDKFPFLREGSVLNEGFLQTLSADQQNIVDQINRRCEFKVLKTTYKLF